MNSVLICNPAAGKHAADGGIVPAVEVLQRDGWTVRVVNSQGPGDTTVVAQQAVSDGLDVVLVAGGDGTLNEAVQALAGTDTALGYLPYGTVNVWARELHIPLDPVAAAQAIVTGRIERLDLGKAGTRYFLLMAGLGFDSVVLHRAKAMTRYKQRFGILPYVAVSLQTAPLYRGHDFELRYDGLIRRVHALMLVVGNTRLYGGWWQFTPNAVANDGWLDVSILKGKGPLSFVKQSFPLLLTKTAWGDDVEVLRVRELAVSTETPVPMQLDGELVGQTPVTFTVAPRALKVIVPREFASDLIA